MNKYSILIAAKDVDNYIEECLDSIEQQTFFQNNNNYEILIGIDKCINTLNKLFKIKNKHRNIKIFFFNQSVGPYIIMNTLLEHNKFNNVIRFDADDVMLPHMIKNINDNISGSDIIRFKFLIYENQKIKKNNSYAAGVLFFKKHILNTLGGFLPWPCAADSEFLKRAKRAKNICHLSINQRLFKYRRHNTNLTKIIPENERDVYHNFISEDIYVKPVISDNYMLLEDDNVIMNIIDNVKTDIKPLIDKNVQHSTPSTFNKGAFYFSNGSFIHSDGNNLFFTTSDKVTTNKITNNHV
jgi:glycosyltransferase involved in cell wall biosynthesis